MSRCPTCGAPVEPSAPHRPFCSARCQLVDLAAWLDGAYVVPGSPQDDDAPDEERLDRGDDEVQ